MSGLRRRALFHPQNFKIICKQAFICKLSIIRKPSNQGPVIGSYLPNEPSCSPVGPLVGLSVVGLSKFSNRAGRYTSMLLSEHFF